MSNHFLNNTTGTSTSDVSIGSVVGLQSALDAKLSKSGGVMSGNLQVPKVGINMDPNSSEDLQVAGTIA